MIHPPPWPLRLAAVAAVALWGAASGCTSTPGGRAGAGWPTRPARAAVDAFQAGIEAFTNGDYREAVRRFHRAIQLDDSMVKAHIHYQEAWVARARRGTALVEYRERLARRRSGLNLYLYGRLFQDPRRKLRYLDEAIARDPYLAWAYLERALLHESRGDPTAARADLARAARLAPYEPVIQVHRGNFAFRRGEPQRALEAYYRALRLDPHNDRACYGLFRTHARHGLNPRAAMGRLKECVYMRPTRGLYLRRLREFAAQHASFRDLAELEEVLAKQSREHPENPALFLTLGWIRLRTGRPFSAIRSLRRAARLGAGVVEVRRDLMRAYVQTGLYGRALETFRTLVAPGLLADPRNRLRERWAAVREATEAAGRAPDIAVLHRLARAYAAVGWVSEARQVYDRVKVTDPERPGVEREMEECTKFLKLVAVLRAYFEDRYAEAVRGKPTRPLAQVLRDIARRARVHADVPDPGPLPMRSYALLGSVLDARRSDNHPLVRYFDRFNHYFVVGQRRGSPVEAFLCARLFEDRSAARVRFGRRVAHRYVLGYNVQIRSFREALDQHLGGATLGREFFVNLDFVQRWRTAVLETYQEFASPRGRADLFHDPAMPAASRAEALDLSSPLALKERLYYLHCVERGTGPAGVAAFLDMVRTHEEGHVLDAERYLPIGSNLWRNLGLVLANGFSARGVEAYLEGDAEVTALAEGAAPRLSLAQLVSFLPAADSAPPHSLGYHEVVRRLVEEVYDHPERYPRIDRRRVILQQLHRLQPAQLRRLGRRIAAARHLRR